MAYLGRIGKIGHNLKEGERPLAESLPALSGSPVSADHRVMETETARCHGVIVFHSGEQMTCANPECDTSSSMSDRHHWFVLCTQIFGSDCGICCPPPTRSEQTEPGQPVTTGRAVY